MKVKAVILVFLIFFSAFQPIQAVTNEGYGEDETSLGQFVDSFETSGNVSTNVQVIRNATLEAMELNQSGVPSPAFEDFTGYTEVDAEGDITVTVNKVEWDTQRRDADNYVYFDFGAGFWGDFVCNFTYVVSNIEAGDASNIAVNWIFAISNHLSRSGIHGGGVGIVLEIAQNGATDDRFRFRHTVLPAATFGAFRNIGTFYISIDKSGTTVRFRAWSDSAHTALLETISIVGNVETFRYISIATGYDVAGGDGADHSSGYVENLWIGDYGGGYASSGYFTTTDYLSDPLANGSALVTMINTSIPANTQILVEFSEDNSTWVFNDWAPLSGGFESVDLRDLNFSSGYHTRFNLSTTNSTVTPRVHQNRLITTIGNVSEGKPGLNVTGEWVEYRASAINASIGIVDGGDLNSTFEIDGDTFNVSEVVGAPGMLLSIKFTDIDPDAECVWVTIWYLYDGNLNHVFEIEMWNFTSSSWVGDGLLVDTAVFVWANSTIYALRIPNDFLSGGEVRVQLNHESPGNINHDLFIDYIRLIAKVPSDVVAAEPFQFFWIVIAIALMIIGIVIARMWPDDGDP